MSILPRFLPLVLLLGSCRGPAPDPFSEDTPTRGDVLILADEDFRTILEAQRLVFELHYPNTHIRLRFRPQNALWQEMMNDSVRVVFTTSAPGAEQQAYFRTRNLSTAMVPVLVDAIAVIKAPDAACGDLSINGITSRLNALDNAPMLFDGTGTGVVRSLIDSLFTGDATALRNAAAVQGTDSLLARLAADPEAIGLLSFARISDLDDPQCRALRDRLRLCPVAADGAGIPVLPNQSTLADGSYPLRRRLYALSMEGKSGLGTGFVSFVAGHRGQRIILKSGLAPQTVPARDVMIVNP